MANATVLPMEIRAVLKAGKTVSVKRRGVVVARIVPVNRPSVIALRRMCRRLNELDKGDNWERFVDFSDLKADCRI